MLSLLNVEYCTVFLSRRILSFLQLKHLKQEVIFRAQYLQKCPRVMKFDICFCFSLIHHFVCALPKSIALGVSCLKILNPNNLVYIHSKKNCQNSPNILQNIFFLCSIYISLSDWTRCDPTATTAPETSR